MDEPESDRRERLVTLRDQITGWLSGPAADRAQLSLRLMTVLEQIEAIDKATPPKKGTVLDELANRRAQSKPAARSPRATRSN